MDFFLFLLLKEKIKKIECVHCTVPRENKRRKVSVVGQKTVTIINTGAAFMGARDWDEETSINL